MYRISGSPQLTEHVEESLPGYRGMAPVRVGNDAWRQTQHVRVATLSARGRASGIPRLQWHDEAAWLVWTDVSGDAPDLHGARVRWP